MTFKIMTTIYQNLSIYTYTNFLVHIKLTGTTKEAPFCMLTIIPSHITSQWPSDERSSKGKQLIK